MISNFATYCCAASIKYAPVSLTSLIQNTELFFAIRRFYFIEKKIFNEIELKHYFFTVLNHLLIDKSWPSAYEITGALFIFVASSSIPLLRYFEKEEILYTENILNDDNSSNYGTLHFGDPGYDYQTLNQELDEVAQRFTDTEDEFGRYNNGGILHRNY